MKKKPRFIFLTNEGFTFSERAQEGEPDIENTQVVGFGEGNNPDEALNNLISENPHLLETPFEEIFCLELAENAEKKKKYFWLKSYVRGKRKF